MDRNYCGKECAACDYREECTGCAYVSMYGNCDIAQCCRQRGHATCDTCVAKERCAELKSAPHKPQQRREAERRAMFKAQENEANAAVMAPALKKIFWLLIAGIAMGLLANIPALATVGGILQGVCSIAIGLLFMTLHTIDKRFRTAGICAVIVAAVNILLDVLGISDAAWALAITIPLLAVQLWGTYIEMTTLSDVVTPADAELGNKWRKLWKYTLIALCGTFGGIFFILIAPALGALVAIIASIWMIVTSIMRIVYIHGTYKLYDGMIA